MLAAIIGAVGLALIVPEPCQRVDVGGTTLSCPAASAIELRRHLRKKLFSNFTVNQTLRDPVAAGVKNPRPLSAQIIMHRMLSLSARSGSFTVDMTIVHEFMDPRWCWNPADWCDLGFLHGKHVLHTDLWLPDVFIEQAKIAVQSTNIHINSTGIVRHRMRALITFYCDMNFVYFPFDKQTCFNQIGADGQFPTEILYELPPEPISLDSNLWKNSVDVYFSSPPILTLIPGESSTERGNYLPLQLSMAFTRVRSRHVMNIFFPIWLINGLSVLALYIDATAAPARVTMAVITVLVLINLQNKLSGELPKLAYTSSMDVYFLVCLLTTIANACEYAVINYLNTTLNNLKADIGLRKSIREKMRTAKLCLRDGDIGIVRSPITFNMQGEFGNKFSPRGGGLAASDFGQGNVLGMLKEGDLVRVMYVAPVPDKPGEQYAKVRVIVSKDEGLTKEVGTVLVSDAVHSMVVCDWAQTTRASFKTKHMSRSASGITRTRSNLTAKQQLEESPRSTTTQSVHENEPYDAPPPTATGSDGDWASTVSSQSSKNGKLQTADEANREKYMQRTALKRKAEIWDSYVLFRQGGDAAHEDDVVALLHHFAGINPRIGQRWVDLASSAGEDGKDGDDLIDFKEFRDCILPQLENYLIADEGERAEPQALEFLCGFFMTAHTIRQLEKRYRWSQVIFLFSFNAVFFIIIVIMSG